MAEQHKITHDMEPMLLTSAEVAGCGGEAIRTSIPKDERKRRSLRTTYEPLCRLWNVE